MLHCTLREDDDAHTSTATATSTYAYLHTYVHTYIQMHAPIYACLHVQFRESPHLRRYSLSQRTSPPRGCMCSALYRSHSASFPFVGFACGGRSFRLCLGIKPAFKLGVVINSCLRRVANILTKMEDGLVDRSLIPNRKPETVGCRQSGNTLAAS